MIRWRFAKEQGSGREVAARPERGQRLCNKLQNSLAMDNQSWYCPFSLPPQFAMTHPTVDACPAPALVYVNTDFFVNRFESEEEQDGCVVLGLVSAAVVYLLMAIGITGAWRLYHLLT